MLRTLRGGSLCVIVGWNIYIHIFSSKSFATITLGVTRQAKTNGLLSSHQKQRCFAAECREFTGVRIINRDCRRFKRDVAWKIPSQKWRTRGSRCNLHRLSSPTSATIHPHPIPLHHFTVFLCRPATGKVLSLFPTTWRSHTENFQEPMHDTKEFYQWKYHDNNNIVNYFYNVNW